MPDSLVPVTSVYFIRHAQSDTSVRDAFTRPLTAQGSADAARLPRAFAGIRIDAVYASPFLRAAATVAPLAAERGLPVVTAEGFRERRSDSDDSWREDYDECSEELPWN